MISKILKNQRFSTLILKEQVGRTSILTLNNEKKRNPLSIECMHELYEHLQFFKTSPKEAKIIIFRHKGPVFSTGHDLKEFQSLSKEKVAEVFNTASRICQIIRTLPQPVIAQLDGLATAAGAQLALACDLITATKRAAISMPGLKVGLFCTTPGVELARTLPSEKRAMELLLLADPISAEKALNWGLFNRIFEDNEIDEKTLALANQITQFSSDALAIGKRTYYQQSQLPLHQAYNMATEVMTENLYYEDTQEGIKAFTEKRHPKFKN